MMISKDKLKHHIEHLKKMHNDLDRQIEEDYKTHSEDRLISVLKKKKLAIKDEIKKFEAQLNDL